MAFKGELFIEGPEGELEGPRENFSSLIYQFEHEIYLPCDPETNMVQGSRRIKAFTVTKDIDKLTPTIAQYCCQGATLPKVTIVLFRIKETGSTEVPYFNFTLEEARIVQVDTEMPTTKKKENENVGHLEKVQFLAKNFTWNFEPSDELGKDSGAPTFKDEGF
jgi:type VI secretion system secreted protein Hcp